MIAGKKWWCKSSRVRASNSTFCYEDGFEVSSNFIVLKLCFLIKLFSSAICDSQFMAKLLYFGKEACQCSRINMCLLGPLCWKIVHRYNACLDVCYYSKIQGGMFPKGSPAIGAGDLLRLLLCVLSFHIHGLSRYSRTILSTFTFENLSAFTFWFQLYQVNTVQDHIQCY